MRKKGFSTIREKNRVIDNIIRAVVERKRFLLLGHQNPDEDCISSLVAFALLLSKFSKQAVIYLGSFIHEHFQYLLNICRFNSIRIQYAGEPLGPSFDTVVICDTPKPSMIEKSQDIDRLLASGEALVMEIDHHLGADSAYCGQEGYCLVGEASSASELVGQLVLKLKNRPELLRDYQIIDPLSRNVVLAILTGIIGDSKMGQFLKSRRERRYYELFSSMFNSLLARETTRGGNFSDQEEVFQELQRLSTKEEKCYNYLLGRKQSSDSFGYVILWDRDMEYLCGECDYETIVSVSRAVADTLAEESGKLSLVVYYDDPRRSDFIQFRVRRSQSYKQYDLRNLLSLFSIRNGGGHEGAIGFRLPRQEIPDLLAYLQAFIAKMEEVMRGERT